MRRISIYFSVLLLFMLVELSVMQPVYAGFDEGLAAYLNDDYKTAFQEFKALAEQGDKEAQFFIGLMYVTAQGVPRDYVMAYMWLNLAASQGLESAVKSRSMMEEEMTSEQIAAAQRLSGDFKAKKP